MVVSLYFGGKSHVSNGQTVSFREPWFPFSAMSTCWAGSADGLSCADPEKGILSRDPGSSLSLRGLEGDLGRNNVETSLDVAFVDPCGMLSQY